MQNLIELFKCLSEPVRLRLLYLLSENPSVCVCDLIEALQLPQSVVSRHLSYLRKYELVTTHKRAQWSYYQLNPNYSNYLLLSSILEHGGHEQSLTNDLIQLNKQSSSCAEASYDN